MKDWRGVGSELKLLALVTPSPELQYGSNCLAEQRTNQRPACVDCLATAAACGERARPRINLAEGEQFLALRRNQMLKRFSEGEHGGGCGRNGGGVGVARHGMESNRKTFILPLRSLSSKGFPGPPLPMTPIPKAQHRSQIPKLQAEIEEVLILHSHFSSYDLLNPTALSGTGHFSLRGHAVSLVQNMLRCDPRLGTGQMSRKDYSQDNNETRDRCNMFQHALETRGSTVQKKYLSVNGVQSIKH
ncbi:hypothetical protein RRG08_022149 [Elysia crispata]|uniref:Uncharacterized protein n=1 Tax=Elysia crispata TaxID=231223 RepID=A0AAE1AIP1_9GAST|nr:hypothetical protein RRG08_022149 [Elysia crispata]